jgi:hypothetical protein
VLLQLESRRRKGRAVVHARLELTKDVAILRVRRLRRAAEGDGGGDGSGERRMRLVDQGVLRERLPSKAARRA